MGQDKPDEPMVCLDMFPKLPPGARARAAFLKTKLWGDERRRSHPKPGQPPIPLRVAFLDGSRALRRKVEAAAREWMKHAHVEFSFGHAPEDAQIRISFAATPGGCWSLLGTDCLTRPSDQPTMNLGKVDARLAPEMLRRYVLHEFGHALGLIHEHSQPGATIPWNEKKVYEHYLDAGWPRKKVKSNVLERYERSDATGTRFDRRSIMLYPIPAQFTDGKLVVDWSTDLSPVDKKFIGQVYPRPPRRRAAVRSSASPENDDHAIIIGIERYRDRTMPPLKGAREDALKFHRWVVSPRGGAVKRRNATLIAPATSGSRRGTARALRRAFLGLCARAKGNARIGRRLYLYLAGHGIAQNRDEASLLASDGGPGAPERHIPGWCYASWFMYSAYFREVVLFADCCRTPYRDLPVQPFPLDDVDSPSAGKAAYVKALAVKYGQSAMEAGDQRGGGLFTSALVDGLTHAFQGGLVTGSSLAAYVHNDPSLSDWREAQEPSFTYEGDVVFAKQPPEGLPRFQIELRPKVDQAPEVKGGPAPGTWTPRKLAARRYVADLPLGIYVAKLTGHPPRYFEVSAGSGRQPHVAVPG